MDINFFNHCNSCTTNQFCQEVHRCMDNMIVEGYGEAEADDTEDPLTSDDDEVGLKRIIVEESSAPLSKEVINLIKLAIQ